MFHQDLPTIIDSPETGLDVDEDEDVSCNQTNVTLINTGDISDAKEESFEDEAPVAESTVMSNGETTLTDEQNESTEADRSQLTKKKRKIQIIKHTTKLNKKMKNSCCSFVTDVAVVDVRGRWVNVSD